MGLNHLPVMAIHHLFSNFTHEQRDILESDAFTRPILPLLDESRDELAASCMVQGKTVAIRRIKMKSTEADRAHDDECGMLWHLLQLELIRLKRVGAGAKEIEEVEGIISCLFPDGLSQIRKSYFVEASEAPLLFRALTRRQVKRLKRILFGNESAYDIAVRWVAAAEKLGDLVRRRAVVEDSDPSVRSASDKREARRIALKRLGFLLDTVEMSGLDATARSALRAPVQAAIAGLEKQKASAEDDNMTLDGGPSDSTEPAAVDIPVADAALPPDVTPAPTPAC